ncbi:NAD kinase [Vagococcus acidifermentans]|uniref:NAD kinase n=1 Tax=Vagococcus acidifermentans TaxID=564710 RepID=UPI001FEAD2BF|nr:NAD kinase [Vagococcus acidifermentans]
MKLAIVSNQSTKSKRIMTQLEEKLLSAGLEIDQNDPDVVLTVGGDGTLLSAFHRYLHLIDKVRFVGIHTGHLGFYTDWRDYEVDQLVRSLQNDEGTSVSYPLLDVMLSYSDSKADKQFLALNEATLRDFSKTMVVDVYIKNDFFERFRGDGLSVSTPTGSTAYSKSLGGAVIHPRLNAIQLNEIASINNRVYRTLGSPLIISGHEWIRIDIKNGGNYHLNIDHLTIPQSKLKSIMFSVSRKKIHFASYRHTPFWRRVNDAFIGEFPKKEQDD